jgi:hypothetical protein
LDSEGSKNILSAALRYEHPDLQDEDALIFSTGTMLYQVFSGKPAFPHSDIDRVRSDIRQGNFIPVNLEVPALEENLAQIINNAIKQGSVKPCLTDLMNVLVSEKSKLYNDFFGSISDDEEKSIMSKREQYQKRIEIKVTTKSFFHKKRTAIVGAAIGLVAAIIVTWNIVAAINKAPLTEGMTPYEVAEEYYTSFGTLNHEFMDAATIDQAGKDDVAMVVNLFVITKVRQAYEMIPPVIPAQEWIDTGSPESKSVIFGVSNLDLNEVNQSANEAVYNAKYLLWIPASFLGDNEFDQNLERAESTDGSLSIECDSIITLTKKDEVWYISKITKQQEN